MSKFLENPPQDPVEQQVAQQPQVQADQPFLVQGERVFKTPDEVTTKLESADLFIEQLKQENAQLRDKVESSTKVDAVLDALKNQEPQQVTQQAPEVQTPSTSSESVEQMVQKALAQTRATEQAEANLANARQAFTGKYGEKAGEVYNRKIAELGMSDAVASNLAKTSPEAFKALFVGESTQTFNSSIASSSGVNTTALSQQPKEPMKVHQIKDKASRIQEISRRIEEAAKKYHNGTL